MGIVEANSIGMKSTSNRFHINLTTNDDLNTNFIPVFSAGTAESNSDDDTSFSQLAKAEFSEIILKNNIGNGTTIITQEVASDLILMLAAYKARFPEPEPEPEPIIYDNYDPNIEYWVGIVHLNTKDPPPHLGVQYTFIEYQSITIEHNTYIKYVIQVEEDDSVVNLNPDNITSVTWYVHDGINDKSAISNEETLKITEPGTIVEYSVDIKLKDYNVTLSSGPYNITTT